jgi:hypothetical protein
MLCFEWASELDELNFKCLDYLFSLGLQFEDNYDIESIKARLLQTTPKKEWGMIWCN